MLVLLILRWTLLQFDRCWVVSNDFRYIAEDGYRSGCTHMFTGVFLLRVPELGPVISPNQDREYLVWVGLIEIDESGFALAARRIVNASNVTAYRRMLANVCRGFRGGQFLLS